MNSRSTGGNPPPVYDPFCGGGSIPLEAQRLGLDAHASDLNPVPVLINKALIEIPPKFAGKPPVNPESREKLSASGSWKGASGLAEDIRYYGQWMRDEAEKRIGHLYPKVKLPKEAAELVIKARDSYKDENRKIAERLGALEGERKAAEERIWRLANYDSLTELPNRAFLRERAARLLEQAGQDGQPLAFLFLDLDHFKKVNDSLGHAVGDRLLVELANRLCSELREQDILGRVGGDEFVLLLPGASATEAAQVVRRLQELVSRPCLDG
jgi:GGDEF domain-containing protein